MAERRMFTKRITDDDRFLALPSTAQALYLHLGMSADDDGFCNQVSISRFKAHAGEQDLETLLNAGFLYRFDSGVVVIRHWRMANAIRKDRYTETTFYQERSELSLDENGAYLMADESHPAVWLPGGCQTVANCLPQDSIGEVSAGEERPDQNKKVYIESGTPSNFVIPTIDQIRAYEIEKDYRDNSERFWNYYESIGWVVSTGKPMRSWKAARTNWEHNGIDEAYY